MPKPALPRLIVVLSASVLCAACSSTLSAYRQDPMALAAPEKPPQDDKATYLELIAQMQRKGAYFASLAHVDAYRLRYGDNPQLRLLQADALRETGQLEQARALYAALGNGPQAAAAWHGLGLIAARGGDSEAAEQALARAVQLQPLNTDYLGDLGFARLRAGRHGPAREPLAMAAELAPGSAKAAANLALWALLADDPATAERIMQSGALNEAARAEVRRLAGELRHAAPARTARVPAAGTHTVARSEVQVAPSMLERFGTSGNASENTP